MQSITQSRDAKCGWGIDFNHSKPQGGVRNIVDRVYSHGHSTNLDEVYQVFIDVGMWNALDRIGLSGSEKRVAAFSHMRLNLRPLTGRLSWTCWTRSKTEWKMPPTWNYERTTIENMLHPALMRVPTRHQYRENHAPMSKLEICKKIPDTCGMYVSWGACGPNKTSKETRQQKYVQTCTFPNISASVANVEVGHHKLLQTTATNNIHATIPGQPWFFSKQNGADRQHSSCNSGVAWEALCSPVQQIFGSQFFGYTGGRTMRSVCNRGIILNIMLCWTQVLSLRQDRCFVSCQT